MLLPGTSIRPFSDSIFIHYKENIVPANGSVSDIASYTIRIVIQSMDRGMDYLIPLLVSLLGSRSSRFTHCIVGRSNFERTPCAFELQGIVRLRKPAVS